MTKLTYTELFYSMQGEGLYLGTPSIFLRLFGCNFRCKNFGLALGTECGEYNPEVKRIVDNLDQYEKFEDLPLVQTGCDTYSSIYPEFQKFSKQDTLEDIVEKIRGLLPGGRFDVNKHMIFTGGEPLLHGNQRRILELLQKIYNSDLNLRHITFETNGTQELIDDLRLFLMSTLIETTFAVSSKLPRSGEKWEDAIIPAAVRSYLFDPIDVNVYFKWVVQNEEDIEYVNKAIARYDMDQIPVYLMPVGGTTSMYDLTHRRVAEIALENGWKYSPRLQVEMWKNDWGT